MFEREERKPERKIKCYGVKQRKPNIIERNRERERDREIGG